MSLHVEIFGDDYSDLELALDEVRRLVGERYVSGANENDTGRFSFTVTEEEQ